MEQGRTEEDNRRLKPPAQPENLPHHQQQPQKCPRCDSLNTKFCYYNNYSLSQPRYFCKTCRRYWTQGGTLRNVPVGGGCRKGKRAKASSSSGDVSRPQPPPPQPPPPHELQSAALRNKLEMGNLGLPPAIPSTASYYSGGGLLSSLTQPQPFNQQLLNIGGGQFAGASNLALLQGFNVPSYSQQHQLQQNEFYQMGSDQSLIQPNRPSGAWNQSLMMNNSINPTASNPSFWNGSTSGASLNPNQWPDPPGYGPPT